MKLRIEREPSRLHSTLGVLTGVGARIVWTLEDEIREIAGQPVSSWKVAKQTAIPAGSYRVLWTFSKRFQRFTPEIVGVEGFTGIRIHGGNTHVDTEGCPIVGFERVLTPPTLHRSTEARQWLDGILEDTILRKKEDVTIDIVDPTVVVTEPVIIATP